MTVCGPWLSFIYSKCKSVAFPTAVAICYRVPITKHLYKKTTTEFKHHEQSASGYHLPFSAALLHIPDLMQVNCFWDGWSPDAVCSGRWTACRPVRGAIDCSGGWWRQAGGLRTLWAAAAAVSPKRRYRPVMWSQTRWLQSLHRWSCRGSDLEEDSAVC